MTFACWPAALALALLAPPAYQTYHNQRFGYRIDYPADLRPQPEPANGDGRRFVSADGQTVLTAYAGYEVLVGGLAEHRQSARQGWQQLKATITLDQPTRTGFVLSGWVRGRIFYQRTVLRQHVLTSFIWEYPPARQAALEAVIEHTMRTWQPSAAGDGGR